MSGFKYPDHTDRREAALEARKAILEKMKTRVIPGHPDFEKLQAERVKAAQEREDRIRLAKEEKIRKEAEEKAAVIAAEAARIRAERAAYQAKLAAEKELQTRQKAARDARYIARKAKSKTG